MHTHPHTNDTLVAPPEREDGPSSGRTFREIQADVAGADLIQHSTPFLNWLAGWHAHLRSAKLSDVVVDPAKTALLSADVIVGFCNEGALASPRVGAIVPPIVKLMTEMHDAGVSRWVLMQEWHEPDAPEFAQYGVHCVRGTREAEMVDELKALPFSDEFQVIQKNSISAGIETGLAAWLDAPENAGVDTFVVVGDCTDLCTYQLAMYVKLRANALNKPLRVVMPEDCVQTYDMPVGTAAELGIVPHDGDLLHLVFLYHMALNGVEVVKRITANVDR